MRNPLVVPSGPAVHASTTPSRGAPGDARRRIGALRRAASRMWREGGPGAAERLERFLAGAPAEARPAFLRGPAGVVLRCAPGAETLADLVPLLQGVYWNEGVPVEVLVRSHLGATAWVVAVDRDRRVIGTARAISDGAKFAWVYDVVVDPAWRGAGLGRRVVRLLLDHPALRHVRTVRLDTRDAKSLYERFGFRDEREVPRPHVHIPMIRIRPDAWRRVPGVRTPSV